MDIQYICITGDHTVIRIFYNLDSRGTWGIQHCVLYLGSWRTVVYGDSRELSISLWHHHDPLGRYYCWWVGRCGPVEFHLLPRHLHDPPDRYYCWLVGWGWWGPVEFHVLPCSTIMLNPLQSEIDTDSIKAQRFMHNQFIQGPEEC